MESGQDILRGKHIVLGVTGGIACYKACELCSRLKKAGAVVDVIMTENATRFVQPVTFETLSLRPVITDTFSRQHPDRVEHIALATEADLVVIAPASANCLAKLACGIADDMLSTTLLAVTAPVLIAPAMNERMWANEATQRNVEALRARRNFFFVGPDEGHLACGITGRGRMSEPAAIEQAVYERFETSAAMQGIRVTVTAGPTREMLDPVRFLSNRSTGKMGYAIAREAAMQGADVTLISGPCSLETPQGCRRVSVKSTEDLLQAVLNEAGQTDILIQAAAPADYTPEAYSDEKIKKTGDGLVLRLRSTPDVAKTVGKIKKAGQVFIGFAAETENLTEYAAKKLKSKNLDMICANDVSSDRTGFETDTNQLLLIRSDGKQAKTPLTGKQECARILLEHAKELLCARRGT